MEKFIKEVASALTLVGLSSHYSTSKNVSIRVKQSRLQSKL